MRNIFTVASTIDRIMPKRSRDAEPSREERVSEARAKKPRTKILEGDVSPIPSLAAENKSTRVEEGRNEKQLKKSIRKPKDKQSVLKSETTKKESNEPNIEAKAAAKAARKAARKAAKEKDGTKFKIVRQSLEAKS